VKIAIVTKHAKKRTAGPLDITPKVNGTEATKGRVPGSAPLGFTANDCLDLGSDLASPVSLDCYAQAPFALNGTIDERRVKYTQ